jgi:UDP-N-acetylmuramoyl-tripeptide--D-alanyl-D-alanine ligase
MPRLTSIQDIYKLFEQNPTICTDTRKIEKQSIFFALKGENFNANEFAQKAIEFGASYAVIDEAKYDINEKYILVNNVLECLQELARYHRKQLSIPFLGITGSNGKTTTKELVNAVVSKKYKTYATIGNFNNHIGVPLTILSITKDIEFAIIEMGANHQKEIELLCSISMPDYGIITNIGKAHLEGFGGIEGIKKGKGELYDFLKKTNGKIFVNADSESLMQMLNKRDLSAITYGKRNDADLSGMLIEDQPLIKVKWQWKSGNQNSVITQLPGAYNLDNVLCAACIGRYFGISEEGINAAIAAYCPDNNRSQIVKKGDLEIILDAYNANPSSMEAAIKNFANIKSPKKLLFLGNMLELGNDSEKEHRAIVKMLEELGFKEVYLVGSHFKNVAENYEYFDTIEECAAAIKKEQIKNGHILIKGSRGSKMERLLEVL